MPGGVDAHVGETHVLGITRKHSLEGGDPLPWDSVSWKSKETGAVYTARTTVSSLWIPAVVFVPVSR